MSAPSLDALPDELFEFVVSYLSLDDIRSLRLASRLIAYKATQDTFRRYYRSKQVDLTSEGLKALVKATARLGSLVEELSLVGIVYNLTELEDIVKSGRRSKRKDEQDCRLGHNWITCSDAETEQVVLDLATLEQRQSEDEELRTAGNDVCLLTEAFVNLAASKRLKLLSLQILVYRDDATTKILPREDTENWRCIFKAASRTFSLVMPCLQRSGLSLQALDIFAKKPESLSCNLPCNTFALTRFRENHTLAMIKTLSIGISDPLVHESEDDTKQSVPEHIMVDTSYSGLARMIEVCRNLDTLEISGYDLGTLHAGMRRRYLHHLARIEPLPKLQNLRLAGLAIDGSDLLLLLTKHSKSLRHVELKNLSAPKESWEPVISYLPDMKLDTLKLLDLKEVNRLMQFEGEPKQQEFTRIYGSYARREGIECRGVDARKKISYYFYTGRAIGAPRVWERTQARREEFGGG